MNKSEVIFSLNVLAVNRKMTNKLIRAKIMDSHNRYLGLIVVFERSKMVIFSFVKDRVWKKLKGWKEKFLPRARKEVIIIVVSKAIPKYVMSCFKIPDECCQEIENMIAHFWWGSRGGKMHWLNW